MKMSLQAHRIMQETRTRAHESQYDIYRAALFAATKITMTPNDIIFRSRLVSLLWALEEYLSSRVGPPPYQSYSPHYLDSVCWLAIAEILKAHGRLVPQPLVSMLAKCVGVNLAKAEITEHELTLAAAIKRREFRHHVFLAT
jgi:hypothetical protein